MLKKKTMNLNVKMIKLFEKNMRKSSALRARQRSSTLDTKYMTHKRKN